MLTAVLISLAVGILFGGFGGYKWGASVERKAASALNSVGKTVGGLGGKL